MNLQHLYNRCKLQCDAWELSEVEGVYMIQAKLLTPGASELIEPNHINRSINLIDFCDFVQDKPGVVVCTCPNNSSETYEMEVSSWVIGADKAEISLLIAKYINKKERRIYNYLQLVELNKAA